MELKNKIVLIDFWAPWCGPCKTMSPIIDKMAVELKGKVKVYKINVEDEEGDGYEFIKKFNVMSLPTILLLDNGKVIEQFIGAQTKDKLIKVINTLCQMKEKKQPE